MNNSRSSNVFVGIGGTLIITVFVVLCLLIFAALSFTTAYSDLKLSNKTYEMIADYYKINGISEEKLAEISDGLTNINGRQTPENIMNSLRNIDGISFADGQSLNNILGIQYEISGEKNQKIIVSLKILYDDLKDTYYYEIASWSLSNIELPSYEDEIIELWEGI